MNRRKQHERADACAGRRDLAGKACAQPGRHAAFRVAETFLIGAAGGALFTLARFPAGWIAGALVFTAAAALLGRPLQLPRPLARVFYVIVGVALGSAVNPAALQGMATWPLSIALVALAMICVSVATTTYLRLVHGFDAMTAMFAGYPGALQQVMAYAAEEECDIRAVAVVQTLRVVILTVGAPAALAALGLTSAASPTARAASLASAPGELMALVAASVAVGLGLLRLGLPGGLLLGPMVVSAVLHGSGLVGVALPGWVTVAGMIGIGAIGGSRFAGVSARRLLSYLGAALGSFAISFAVAALFAALAGRFVSAPLADVAVAYLPGAIDAMMALALALALDPIFIGAHHLARLFGLSFALPFVIRVARGRAHKRDGGPTGPADDA